MIAAMPAYFEFEVSLLEIEPRIWRRFQIDAEATFGDLHMAIQDCFDWDRDHMWMFHTVGRSRRDRRMLAGPGTSELRYGDDEIPDAWSVRLRQYFKGSTRTCRYVYDFGDDWVHAVKLRPRVDSAERFQRRLLAGSRAAPKEDCGGVDGYWRLVKLAETGNDPWDVGPDELPDWINDWQPDRFDLEAAKAAFDS